MATNAEILGQIINKWAQPLIGTYINQYAQSMPFVQAIQNKVRSTGWVSGNWSLMAELSPLMEGLSGNIVAPLVSKWLSGMDDDSIPKLAHAIVENAIKKGELRLLEGKVIFELSDLQQLKRLLDLNMPCNEENEITIKTE